MKILFLLIILLILPTMALSQTMVEFHWTQPDSTAGTLQPDGTICCKSLIPDGGIAKYEVFTATPADTLYWGFVNAPHIIAEDAIAVVPVEVLVPTSIAVRAVDTNGRTGQLSNYSIPFTVDPGPPDTSGTPIAVKVYFGG